MGWRRRRRRLDGSAHRSANCPVNYSSVVLLSVTPFVLSRSCGLLLIIFIRIIIIINSGRETCGKSIYHGWWWWWCYIYLSIAEEFARIFNISEAEPRRESMSMSLAGVKIWKNDTLILFVCFDGSDND